MTTIVCNTGTAEEILKDAVAQAAVVVASAGKPGLIRGEWIKPGSIVIDVGTTEVKGNLVGDVELEEAKKKAAFITPVPGGVGPLTVTMLMKNLIVAYKWQKGL
jgi:methylenetetrahydrofolate dehydrogenase (NADP+)/methenyltetrahydrofolate cyclohydrolase